MNAVPVRRTWLWLLFLLFAVVIAVAVTLYYWSHVTIIPDPPTATTAPVELPATASHASVTIKAPKAAIVEQLDHSIPKTYKFDVNSAGVRAYGSPSRGPIDVQIDRVAKRVSGSTHFSGKVQVEKKVKVDVLFGEIDKLISVGADISGEITISLSPVIATTWTINPHLDLSVKVDKAVAKTPVGDINVTGLVQGAIADQLNDVKRTVEGKLKETLDVRKKADRLWTEIDSAHKLKEDPATWLRITPRQVAFGQFHYLDDSIDSGLGIDLDTHVFLQETAPEVIKTPLPDLNVSGPISDDFTLSIPIDVSYAEINQQLKAQLIKAEINLPQDARVTIIDATITPYGDGIMLTVDFSGKRGWFNWASGRLYVVGIPVLDAAKAELRLDKLDFTTETRSILLKAADWLVHETLLNTIKSAAVIKLDDHLKEATQKANSELDTLKARLPKEVGANVTVTQINLERLVFAKDRAFIIVTAKGKMSARLEP